MYGRLAGYEDVNDAERLSRDPGDASHRGSKGPRSSRRLDQPHYDAHHAVRRVCAGGEIKWAGRAIFISETLAGEPVGIAETRRSDWLVRYANIDLGIIDPRRNRLIRFVSPKADRKRANKPERLLPMYPV